MKFHSLSVLLEISVLGQTIFAPHHSLSGLCEARCSRMLCEKVNASAFSTVWIPPIAGKKPDPMFAKHSIQIIQKSSRPCTRSILLSHIYETNFWNSSYSAAIKGRMFAKRSMEIIERYSHPCPRSISLSYPHENKFSNRGNSAATNFELAKDTLLKRKRKNGIAVRSFCVDASTLTKNNVWQRNRITSADRPDKHADRCPLSGSMLIFFFF